MPAAAAAAAAAAYDQTLTYLLALSTRANVLLALRLARVPVRCHLQTASALWPVSVMNAAAGRFDLARRRSSGQTTWAPVVVATPIIFARNASPQPCGVAAVRTGDDRI
jgi:hypothetical protein